MGVVFTESGQQMFVWDKAGRVWVSNWNGAQYVRQTAPVLDISDEVGNWRDFGLLSMCLDPNYEQNGRIFLYYIVDRYNLLNANASDYDRTRDEYFNASIGRLTRYQLTTANNVVVANPGSRFVLLGESKLSGVPLIHESHAGATLLFGDDGTLLLSTGDNANYNYTDIGSGGGTYWQQAISDGIMGQNENVGAFRSQMLTSLCGKILRLNPETGDGIGSNPYFDASNPRSARSRVWALGFRNPFRMAIQRGSGSPNPADARPGTLIVGDVGMNTWEEFSIIRQGGVNAGWPMYEGIEANANYMQAAQTLENKDEPNPANTCNKPFLTFADLLKPAQNETIGTVIAGNPCSQEALPGFQRRYFHYPPALDWKHLTNLARYPTFSGNTLVASPLGATGATVAGQPFGGNCSVAGAWYTGTRFPADYQGAYFFADYGTNWIRVARLNDSGVTEIKSFAPDNFAKGIVDLEYSKLDQSIYYVNINSGEIMRISYGGNRPPVAAINADKLTGSSPLTVAFRGDGSSDPDGYGLTYAWDFGDGTTSTAANPTHTFTTSTQAGFTVRLTVTDNEGLTASEQVVISVGNKAPTVRITSPVNNSLYPLDRESQYTLTASVNDDDPTGLTYAWQVVLRHNNHEHREPVIAQAQPLVNISPVGCDGETYYYLIRLTVTDRGGLTASDSVRVLPNCGSANLSVSNLQATAQSQAVALSWTNSAVAFDQVLVVAKEGSGFLDKPSGLNYTADANYGGGGTVQEGGKVVYKGTGSSVTVTGLTNGRTYYFRVYTLKGTAWTGGVQTSATPTFPPLTVDPAACYRLTARHSGKALEVENGSTTDRAAVKQRTYAGRPWQQWKIQPTDGGFYRLTAVHSDKVLTVNDASRDNFAPIVQLTNSAGQNQQWQFLPSGQGYYGVMARHSGKVLDVNNGNTSDGAQVIQYTSAGSTNQQWLVEVVGCPAPPPPPPPPTPTPGALTIDPAACYRLTARHSGKALEVENGSTTDRAAVKQRTYAGRPWQQWKIQPTDGGFYRLTAVHSGKALDVNNASTADLTPVVQWATNGGQNQQWRFQANGQGYYTVLVRHSGKALDVNNGSTSDGGQVIQYTSTGAANQQWLIETVGCAANGRLAKDSSAEVLALAADAKQAAEQSFSIYPNPAQDYVDIDLQAAIGRTVSLGLADALGRVVDRVSVGKVQQTLYRLGVGHLSSGHYWITIEVEGQNRVVRRLAVVR